MFPKTIDGEVFNFYTCKITDFNSSTFMKNQTQSCRGSSGFMAPELEYSSPNSSEVISPALDVFRLVRHGADIIECVNELKIVKRKSYLAFCFDQKLWKNSQNRSCSTVFPYNI